MKLLLQLQLGLALAAATLATTVAFQPNSEDHGHWKMTKKALLDLGFCPQAAKEVNKAQRAGDWSWRAAMASGHCDNEEVAECHARIVKLANEAITEATSAAATSGFELDSASSGDREDARFALGLALHPLQDFYSHSTHVNFNHTTPHASFPPRGGSTSAPIAAAASFPGVAGEDDAVCEDDHKTLVRPAPLTTGFFSVRTPSRKCRHGKLLKGIAKDEPGSFDIYNLYGAAYSVAAQATVGLVTEVLARLSDEAKAQLRGTAPDGTCGKTLAFVIDRTGSMSDDIASVRSVIRSRVGAESDVQRYVLTTFSDLNSGGAPSSAIYSTKESFLGALDAVSVSGGGDCPEDMMAGILAALATVEGASSGDAYVFSDATAKDYARAPEVAAALADKPLRINFLLTGACGGVFGRTGAGARGAPTPTAVPRAGADEPAGDCASNAGAHAGRRAPGSGWAWDAEPDAAVVRAAAPHTAGGPAGSRLRAMSGAHARAAKVLAVKRAVARHTTALTESSGSAIREIASFSGGSAIVTNRDDMADDFARVLEVALDDTAATAFVASGEFPVPEPAGGSGGGDSFSCDGGSVVIPSYWVCDDWVDCSDGSDEAAEVCDPDAGDGDADGDADADADDTEPCRVFGFQVEANATDLRVAVSIAPLASFDVVLRLPGGAELSSADGDGATAGGLAVRTTLSAASFESAEAGGAAPPGAYEVSVCAVVELYTAPVYTVTATVSSARFVGALGLARRRAPGEATLLRNADVVALDGSPVVGVAYDGLADAGVRGPTASVVSAAVDFVAADTGAPVGGAAVFAELSAVTADSTELRLAPGASLPPTPGVPFRPRLTLALAGGGTVVRFSSRTYRPALVDVRYKGAALPMASRGGAASPVAWEVRNYGADNATVRVSFAVRNSADLAVSSPAAPLELRVPAGGSADVTSEITAAASPQPGAESLVLEALVEDLDTPENTNVASVQAFAVDGAACPGASSVPCSGAGVCVTEADGPARCACSPGYSGADCSEYTAGEPDCGGEPECGGSGRGACVFFAGAWGCECAGGFGGDQCERQLACPSPGGLVCSGRGTCAVSDDGFAACECDDGFSGDDCAGDGGGGDDDDDDDDGESSAESGLSTTTMVAAGAASLVVIVAVYLVCARVLSRPRKASAAASHGSALEGAVRRGSSQMPMSATSAGGVTVAGGGAVAAASAGYPSGPPPPYHSGVPNPPREGVREAQY